MTLSFYYIIRLIKAMFASMSAKQTARKVCDVFLFELKGSRDVCALRHD